MQNEGKISGPPKAPVKTYDRSLMGLIGKMGSKDSSITYLQVNLQVSELDLLGLVSDIPGSEKWPIRQLFQRDIDSERVKQDIIPYFLDSQMAKFFNPLTIAVLPIDSHGSFSSIGSERECQPDPDYHKAFALDTSYKVSYADDGPWALIQWQSSKVKLIAIDGQHRLSALKRIYALYQQNPADPKILAAEFSNWIIPVVLVTLGHKEAGNLQADALLERTRNIFVTINKQAKPPSRTRTILLNDYSALAVAVQETLDHCKHYGISLGIFNWREFKDEDRPACSTYLLSVDELEDIFKEYLLGEDAENSIGLDLSSRQEGALYWEDLNVSSDIKDVGVKRDLIKKRFLETILPSFYYILANIHPYSSYIGFVRDLECKFKDDIQKHAWSRLVYGSDYAPGFVEAEVKSEKIRLLENCESQKVDLGEIFSKAIGLRGVYAGFCQYYEFYCSNVCFVPWIDAAKSYVEIFNTLHNQKYFSPKKMPPHLVFDHNGTVVNYRLDGVRKSFGAYIAYCCLYAADTDKRYQGGLVNSDLRDSLVKTLISGFKKEHRKKIKEDFASEPIQKINDELLKIAKQSAENVIIQMDKRLEKSSKKL